jgi:hypothetical protein
VKAPDSSATDPDPVVAAAVRLLHRRRGWIWATVISAVAWVVAVGLLGSLAPNGTGPGAVVGVIFVLLLTAAFIVGLVASIVDTALLRRRYAGVRRQAGARTAHYPARAHASSYPPRHRFTLVYAWFVMAILLGIGVASLPGMIDGVAYLAGAERSTTFTPTSYGQDCGRSGCHTVTNGTLSDGTSVTWNNEVPLGEPFSVREPLWDWGFGAALMDGDPAAVVYVILGLLFDGFSVLVLVHLVKLGRNWLRHRQHGRPPVTSGWLPNQ